MAKNAAEKEAKRARLSALLVADLEIDARFKLALLRAGYTNVSKLVVWLKGRDDGMYSALMQLNRVGEFGAAQILHHLVQPEAIKRKHLNSIPIEVLLRHGNLNELT